VKHYINDIEISPRNLDSIGLVSDFTGNPDVLKLNVDSIVLTRDAFNIVKDHVNTQGVFEGIPYKIEMSAGVTIQYYIDLLQETVYKDHEVEVKIKQRKNIDNFLDRAKGTSWELMASKGVVFEYKVVDFLIVKDNQAELVLTTGVTLFVLYKTLAEQIEKVQELIAAVTAAIGIDPSDVLAAAIKLAAAIIYTITLIYLINQLVLRVIETIYPRTREMKGVLAKELLTKGCSYLDYSFQSTLIDSMASNLTILPIPLLSDDEGIFDKLSDDFLLTDFGKGYPSSSDSIPTIWSLFEQLEIMFNAKTRIINGVVQLERWDFWQDQISEGLFPAMVLQSERQDAFSYNTDEVWKRYYIHYNLDYTDAHTQDIIYEYNDAEFSTEPTSVVNQDLVSITNLSDVNINFSLGSRKLKLTVAEKIMKGIFTVVDLITAVFTFGNGTDLSSKVDDRKGMLQISQQYFANTKILYLVGSKQPENWYDYLSAKSLWDNYHYINQITLNGWEIRENARIRLKASEFMTILDNNYAEIDGVLCEILRVEYIDETSFALISYRKPSDYAVGKVYNLVINE
jgi:hypothetical protein